MCQPIKAALGADQWEPECNIWVPGKQSEVAVVDEDEDATDDDLQEPDEIEDSDPEEPALKPQAPPPNATKQRWKAQPHKTDEPKASSSVKATAQDSVENQPSSGEEAAIVMPLLVKVPPFTPNQFLIQFAFVLRS